MMHNKKAAKHRFAPAREDTVSLASILKSALFALFIAAGIGALLLLLSAALLLLTENPSAYTGVVAPAACYLTAFAAGMIATRLHARRLPLFCGLATGVLFLALLLLTAALLPRASACTVALQAGLYALIPCFTVVGALIGGKRKSTPRRRKRAF